jgi:hypothetical protein
MCAQYFDRLLEGKKRERRGRPLDRVLKGERGRNKERKMKSNNVQNVDWKRYGNV